MNEDAANQDKNKTKPVFRGFPWGLKFEKNNVIEQGWYSKKWRFENEKTLCHCNLSSVGDFDMLNNSNS